jgi:hypothetical protein
MLGSSSVRGAANQVQGLKDGLSSGGRLHALERRR